MPVAATQEASWRRDSVGTELTSEEASELFDSHVAISGDLSLSDGNSASFAGATFVMPKDSSGDYLDAIIQVINYQRGIIPVRLEPGNSVARQFVLRTRSRLLFRPLSHTFQIQENYFVEDVDHTGKIPCQPSIQAALGSIAWGSVVGTTLETLVKILTQSGALFSSAHLPGILQAIAVSVMASIAVVVTFAQKDSAQPFVSIEDFWGGLVIGFTVGYFTFQTCFRLSQSADNQHAAPPGDDHRGRRARRPGSPAFLQQADLVSTCSYLRHQTHGAHRA